MLFNNILEEKKRTELEYTAVHIRSDQRSRCLTILFCYCHHIIISIGRTWLIILVVGYHRSTRFPLLPQSAQNFCVVYSLDYLYGRNESNPINKSWLITRLIFIAVSWLEGDKKKPKQKMNRSYNGLFSWIIVESVSSYVIHLFMPTGAYIRNQEIMKKR